jgi:hypothetical protein
MIYIYKTTNTVNNKFYVGKHKGDINDLYLGSGLILKNAIEKYNIANFKKELIEVCTEDNVNDREKYWIKELKPEYNISEGGDGGNTWQHENHPNYQEIYNKRYNGEGAKKYKESIDKYFTKEVRDERRQMLLNPKHNIHSDESKQKSKDSIKQGWIDGKYEHLRENMSKVQTGRVRTENEKAHLSKVHKEIWSDKEKLEDRNNKIRDTYKDPELRKLRSEQTAGVSNPNFKWIYIISRDSNKYNTFGKALSQWVEENKDLGLTVSSITYAAKTKSLPLGYTITRVHKDDWV